MKFRAQIDIMPMEEILDPQGKVVTASLHNLGLSNVDDVRIGKHIRLFVDAPTKQQAEEMVDTACKKTAGKPDHGALFFPPGRNINSI